MDSATRIQSLCFCSITAATLNLTCAISTIAKTIEGGSSYFQESVPFHLLLLNTPLLHHRSPFTCMAKKSPSELQLVLFSIRLFIVQKHKDARKSLVKPPKPRMTSIHSPMSQLLILIHLNLYALSLYFFYNLVVKSRVLIQTGTRNSDSLLNLVFSFPNRDKILSYVFVVRIFQ